MAFQNDLVVYDAVEDVVLVVEVKNKRGTTPEWAVKMRRNLLAHGLMATAPYFLLALPDAFYLWIDQPLYDREYPSYVIDPVPSLEAYFEQGVIKPENFTGIGFELLIQAWLNDVIWSEDAPAAWLVESGLYDAIRHGHLAPEVAL